MINLLKSNSATMFWGCFLYLLVTGYLLAPAKVFSNVPHPAPGESSNRTGPSWDFFNPEMDRLMLELAKEKKDVAARGEQLNELATRLEAERSELNIVLQSVQRKQKEFDTNVLRVRDEESANLKKLAKVYGAMSPEGAAGIIKQMEDDQIAKFLVFMKEDEVAPVLESFAKLGPAEAKRAAAISERLRTAIFRHPAPKFMSVMLATHPLQSEQPAGAGEIPVGFGKGQTHGRPPTRGARESFASVLKQASSSKDSAADPQKIEAPASLKTSLPDRSNSVAAPLQGDKHLAKFDQESPVSNGDGKASKRAKQTKSTPLSKAAPLLPGPSEPSAGGLVTSLALDSSSMLQMAGSLEQIQPGPAADQIAIVEPDRLANIPSPQIGEKAGPGDSSALGPVLALPSSDTPAPAFPARSVPAAPATMPEVSKPDSGGSSLPAPPPAPPAQAASAALNSVLPQDSGHRAPDVVPAISPTGPEGVRNQDLPVQGQWDPQVAKHTLPSVGNMASSGSDAVATEADADQAWARALLEIVPEPPVPVASEPPGRPGPVRADGEGAPTRKTTALDAAQPDTSGIGSARTSPRMKKAEETDLVEQSGRQLLPSGSALADNSATVVRDQRSSPGPVAEGTHVTIPVTFDLTSSNTQTIMVGARALSESMRMHPAVDLDQLQTLITQWAVDIKRTRADAMEVVLKPNDQTEISLRVSLQDGVVAVAADFKQGDLAGLKAHWQQLQESLSIQGIRLGPIQAASAADFSGLSLNNGFNQSRGHLATEKEMPEIFTPKPGLSAAVPNQQTKILPRVSAPKRRWESWA